MHNPWDKERVKYNHRRVLRIYFKRTIYGWFRRADESFSIAHFCIRPWFGGFGVRPQGFNELSNPSMGYPYELR